MFFGEYEHTIDTKGRVIIPAKLRDALGESFIISKGLDGCLSVYSMEQWTAVLKGTNWKTNVPATEVVCTDGTISISEA